MNNKNIKAMLHRYSSKVSEKTKIREILQQTALLGLERHGFFEKAAFYGGTALRILHGLDRFSEDLDFTLLKPEPDFDFSIYLKGMQKELHSFGYEAEVQQKSKNLETSVISAFMKMSTLKLYLTIGDEKKARGVNSGEKIQIKLEIDTDPPPYFRIEIQPVLNPVEFNVTTLHLSDLFAGKMLAILCRAWKGRVKGRDWYDLIWYIQKKIPLSMRYLQERMRQAGQLGFQKTLDETNLMKMLREKIDKLDWESAKADMRSFISDPQRLEIWSPTFFHAIIKHLLIE